MAPKSAKRKPRAAAAGDQEKRRLREQFQKLDVNQDGTLSQDELRDLLKKLNPKLSNFDLQRLFCQIDTNKNGKVELDEFMEFMFSGKRPNASTTSLTEGAAGNSSALEEGPAEAADGPSEEWIANTLETHNELRAIHGAPAMTWSNECYAEAKKQADACQARSSLFHGHLTGASGRHGQNAYWSSMPGIEPRSAILSWYDEIVDPGYDFGNPGFSGGTGHFTQVVWMNSTQVGMAVSDDNRFVVANYFPAGNMVGAFEANVLPPDPEHRQDLLDKFRKEEANRKAERKAAARPAQNERLEGGESVTAESMTPELQAMFEGCPFSFEKKVQQAFAEGKAQVTVTKDVEGDKTKMQVIIKTTAGTSTATGTWGGG